MLWTSEIYWFFPLIFLRRNHLYWKNIKLYFNSFWLMNIRIPIIFSLNSFKTWGKNIIMFVLLVMMIRVYIAGEVPIFPIFFLLNPLFPMPVFLSWNKTIVPQKLL